MAKIYKLDRGASLVDEILKIAKKEKIKTARLEAIGGVNRLTLAYYNHTDKKYEEHSYSEFMELTSLLGNITQKDGKPILHAHCTAARRDQTVLGGHLISAAVFPLAEIVITPTKNRAKRKFDEELGLNVIHKIED
ncbi:MAG TPA: PPC domain-containing DNA-binding protein [Nitrososphaerales archaeon]|nr:PPC domain-containing DNA-binding protein [Nitrososphaerales archaeon]